MQYTQRLEYIYIGDGDIPSKGYIICSDTLLYALHIINTDKTTKLAND